MRKENGGFWCCLADVFLAAVNRDGESHWEVSVSTQAGRDHVPSDGSSRGTERKGSARDLV